MSHEALQQKLVTKKVKWLKKNLTTHINWIQAIYADIKNKLEFEFKIYHEILV